jgi:hypothetical protein
MALTKVSFSMINGGPLNVLDFGAKGDGTTDDTAAIQAAIDFAATQNGNVILIPNGTYKITSTLLITTSNIMLQGQGGDNLHDGGTGAFPSTTILWGGGVFAGSMFQFYTIQNVANAKINGGGLANMFLDCAGLLAGGVTFISVSNAVLDHLTIMHPTYVGVQLTNYISGQIAEAADSQRNFITNVNVRCLDLAACLNANGYILTSNAPFVSNANTSFNTYTYCSGQFQNGTGFLLLDADNNNLISCTAFMIGTGKGLDIQGADSNYFYDFSSSGFPSKLFVRGTASGFLNDPKSNCFLFPDQGNGTTYPTVDAGCAIYWQGSDGVGVNSKFNKTIISDSNATAIALYPLISTCSAIIDNTAQNNLKLTKTGDFANAWGINVGSGASGNDFRINPIGTGRVNIGNGAAVDIPASAVTFANIGTTAVAANAYLDNATSNNLLRSTSSIKYKSNVETIDAPFSNAVLSLRPVWYRSLAKNDNKDWSWYGLIAEEVAQVEPRLVHWSYADDCYDVETVTDLSGVKTEYKTLKDNATLTPDGVQYERVSVLLLDVVKKQAAQIQDLTARLTQLEAKIPA